MSASTVNPADGYTTPPRQESPRRNEKENRPLAIWLQAVMRHATNGSGDDLSSLSELAKQIPVGVSDSVVEEISRVANGDVFDCARLVNLVSLAMRQKKIPAAGTNVSFERVRSPLFFSKKV